MSAVFSGDSGRRSPNATSILIGAKSRAKEVIPKLIEAGLKRIAIVSSTDGLNVIAVDNMVNTIPMGTATVAFFDDPAMAQLWLLKNDGVEVSIPVKGTKGPQAEDVA